MYQFFRLAAKVVPRLPNWLLHLLPLLIGPLAWLVASGARRQATINAAHVLGLEIRHTRVGRRKLRRVVRGMFRYSISNYLDAFVVPGLSAQDLQNTIVVSNVEYIKEALALGKGLILFSAHFGPFEYVAQWFALNGYQIVIPVEKLADERMLRLILKLRTSQGVHFLPLGGSAPMRTIIQTLRKNQIVLITADRAVEGESVIKDFFGAPARVPIGPVNLSLRTGAPLIGGFTWHASGGKIIGTFSHLTMDLLEEERKQTDLVEAAVIKKMEQFISAHPEQWIVFSPVWIEPGTEEKASKESEKVRTV